MRLKGLRQKVGMVTQDVRYLRPVSVKTCLYLTNVLTTSGCSAIEELGLDPWFRSLPEVGFDGQFRSAIGWRGTALGLCPRIFKGSRSRYSR